MPLTEIDQNISNNGRTSRSSVSTTSAAFKDGPKRAGQPNGDFNAGVLGMLRTTTETGDLGALSVATSRLPKLPRGNTRRPNGNNLSRTSSHYSQSTSIRSKASNRSLTEQSNLSIPGSWPTNQQMGGQHLQHDRHGQSRSASGQRDLRSLSRSTSDHLNPEQRAYSLTTSLPPIRSMSSQHSTTSLRSHDTAPRQRSPRRHPAAMLRRPLHRPVSPALSDSVGMMHQGGRIARPGPGLRAYTSHPGPQQQQRNVGYGEGHQPPGALRLYQSLEDFDGQLAAPNRSREPMLPFEPRPLRAVNAPPPALLHPQDNQPQGYGRTAQQFKNSPSPLREAYTRFGNHNQSTTLPSQPAVAPSQFASGAGFVQRVKNLLEDRASGDSPRPAQTQSPRKHMNVNDQATTPSRPVSSNMVNTVIRPDENAVDVPANGITIDALNQRNSTFYPAEENNSSGDDSSVRADESAEHTHLTSTPNLRGRGANAPSEVYTNASSTDSPMVPGNFSLKIAIQKATAPTISESSQSAADLTEFSAIMSPFPSEPAELDRTTDRPFSFPLSSPSKRPPISSNRQSMPPTVNLATLMMLGNGSPEVTREVTTNDLKGYKHEELASVPLEGKDIGQASADVDTPILSHELDEYSSAAFVRSLSVMESTFIEHGPGGLASAAFVRSLPVEESTADHTNLARPQSEASPRTLDVTSNGKEETIESLSAARPRSEGANLALFDIPSWAKASIAARQSYASEANAVDSARSTMSSLGVSGARMSQSFEAAANSSAKRLSNRDSGPRAIPPVGVRGSLPLQATPEGSDPRMSTAKYQNFALPDLTEDSQEDASTTNLRMLGARPHPFRASGPRGPRGDMRTRSRTSAGPEPPSSYLPSRKLKDTRGIPSFTFSNTDLTASMNRALGLRSSKSMEEIRKSMQRRGREGVRASRLFTSEDLDCVERIRYRSFFRGLEKELSQQEMTVEPTENTVPDELIAEIDRISIPSVKSLTVRLSELMPGFGRSSSLPDITKSGEALKTALAEIRDIGSNAELGNIDSKRNSLVSSMVAAPVGRKNTISSFSAAKDERTPSRLAMLLLNKDLPPLPSDIRSPRPSVASGLPHSNPEEEAHPISIVAELEGTVSTRFASGSQAGTVRNVRVSSGEDVNIITPANTDVAMTTNIETHKQLNDFTDSDDTRELDITVAAPSKIPASPPPRQSKLTHAESRYSDENVRIARSMSPGPHFGESLIPESKISTTLEKEPSIKKGAIGSLIRRMGIKSRVDKAGFPIDPDFLHPEERSTSPGDRFPTTGLTLPTGLNIEDNRSFFSDDSSDHEQPRAGTLRKRLKRVRQQNRSTSRVLSLNETTGETHRSPSAIGGHDGSVFGGSQLEPTTNLDVALMMYDQPPTGMSKMEFRAKKMVEKLRSLWYRSGRLIRGIKHQKKQRPGWYEHDVIDTALGNNTPRLYEL